MSNTFDLNKVTRPYLHDLKPYASARDEYAIQRSDWIYLDANENPYQNGVNRYPDPHQKELKNIVASLKEVQPNQLLFGNGSDEILDLIFRAFCEPNHDEILIMPPTYGMYKILANINSIALNEVFLTTDFKLDITKILKAITNRTKAIFLCSPNNPTGNSFDVLALEQLLTSFQGIVVLDEAYIDFSTRESWVKRLRSFPNLIITQTLSKAYGMAGIRLGIALASAEIIDALKKIKPPYNINELSQQWAIKALKNQTSIHNQTKAILEQRKWLEGALQTIPYIKEVYPSDANFILVRVDDAILRYEELLSKGVVVRNRSHEIGCAQCLRISVGTYNENIFLLNALQR